MAILQPQDYNIRYFDPELTDYRHNAGYVARYRKVHRISNAWLPIEESTGEYYGDLGKYLVQRFDLSGKRVLELGCAKGFIVEGLRAAGADAYGIDFSDYAINAANPDIRPYLILEDARTALSKFEDGVCDLLFSRWFLPCIPDKDLPALIAEMNRISKQQVHLIWEDHLPQYYNCKPLSEWLDMGFAKGTILMSRDKLNSQLVK